MHKTAMTLVKKHKLTALSSTLVDVLLTQIENDGPKRTATHYEKKAKKEETNKKVYAQLAKLAGLMQVHSEAQHP